MRRRASRCLACDMPAALLHVDGLAKQYRRGVLRPEVTFSLEADFAIDAPCDRRRHGAERLGQDDALRAHHGQQRPVARPRPRRRAGHPRGALRRARPARDPLPPVVPGAPVPAHATARRRWRARRAASRSCTCSTSRSSTPRTATSASCSTSSAALRRRERLVFLCLHPNEPLPSRHPARELRPLRVRRSRPPDARALSAGARSRRARPRLSRPPRHPEPGPTGPAPPSRREGSEAGREQP